MLILFLIQSLSLDNKLKKSISDILKLEIKIKENKTGVEFKNPFSSPHGYLQYVSRQSGKTTKTPAYFLFSNIEKIIYSFLSDENSFKFIKRMIVFYLKMIYFFYHSVS